MIDVETWLLLNVGADPQQITERLNEIAADNSRIQGRKCRSREKSAI